MKVTAQAIARLLDASIDTAREQAQGDPYFEGRLDALEDLKDQIENGAVL